MLCPRCGDLLDTVIDGILECTRCQGIWLAQPAIVRGFALPWPVGPNTWWRRGLPCPECAGEGLTSEMQLVQSAQVTVDRCQGHGVWLDHGELARVLGVQKGEELAAIFRALYAGQPLPDAIAARDQILATRLREAEDRAAVREAEEQRRLALIEAERAHQAELQAARDAEEKQRIEVRHAEEQRRLAAIEAERVREVAARAVVREARDNRRALLREAEQHQRDEERGTQPPSGREPGVSRETLERNAAIARKRVRLCEEQLLEDRAKLASTERDLSIARGQLRKLEDELANR
ncbi:MAG: hypothetical protein JWP01_2592 [Myxococcales bacterium]|nr:hypothetical protein [Myxococcales bacterium]